MGLGFRGLGFGGATVSGPLGLYRAPLKGFHRDYYKGLWVLGVLDPQENTEP